MVENKLKVSGGEEMGCNTTRKIILLYIAFLLITSSIFTATAFTINPSEINVSGKNGERIQKEITLENTLNVSINITTDVSTSLQGMVSIPSTIEISANSTKKIKINLWCNTTTGGFIKFTNGTDTETVLISLNMESGGSDIVIYPSDVIAGKTFAFTVPSGFSDCSGFVFCEGSSNLYYFLVEYTVGSVTLSHEDYGDAKIWIFTENKSKTKEFEVSPSYENVILNIPTKITTGSKETIQLLIDTTPYRNQHITVTNPDGINEGYDTNSNGEITVDFDIGGEWEVKTVVGETTIKETFSVAMVQLDISLSEKKPVVDREFEIITEPGADVFITSGAVTWSFESDNDGIVLFTPLMSGTYEITATKGKKEGKKVFKTGDEVVVYIRNEKGDYVNKLQADKQYTVTVEDNDGPVEDIERIEVVLPNDEIDYIPLNNGRGKGTPWMDGSYMLSPFTTDYLHRLFLSRQLK